MAPPFATLITACALTAPPNDRFADRIALEGPFGQAVGSNAGATLEPNEPGSGVDAGKSVWWRWQAPAGGTAVVHTLGSAYDTVLAVWRGGALTALTLVAENDDWDGQDSVQSAVAFTAAGGTEYQVQVSGYEGAEGPILLTWHLEPAGSVPPNDAFRARQRLEGDAGRLFASNRRATREAGEPQHAGDPGGRSLWYAWTAPGPGTLALDTAGSSVDTVLAAYTGTALSSLAAAAADDDRGLEYTSRIDLDVPGGVELSIAADGFDGGSGLVVLAWSFTPACAAPRVADAPDPPAGARDVPLSAVLRWNVRRALVRKVIYGQDDRREVHQADPALRKVWESTAALVPAGDVVDNGDRTYSLPPETFGEQAGLCPGEPFAAQPAPAVCSGFLVGPDLVATAGHCAGLPSLCAQAVFVFGFGMVKPGEVPLRIPASQVYRCAGIAGALSPDDPEDLVDWALVRLDRPVPDREPLRVRRTGKVPDSQALVLIGHPAGLPAKIAGGARVRDNSSPETFTANLDSFAGNSGSAVLNADTLVVEGILVAGEVDFVEDGGCLRTNRCPQDGCQGELAVRTTVLEHAIPASERIAFEVSFGPCGRLEPLGTTAEESLAVGPLEPGATYCWQVTARGECGASAGPVWSFTTAEAGPAPPFLRGDAQPDGKTDLSDAVFVLNHLFTGAAGPRCEESADLNDDGGLDLSDAVYLLNHLFTGGPTPPEPRAACGADPTPDALGCAAFDPCGEA
ncbi:MAG: trypsin-like peptidase domain-containing protein [Planctomycetes bacterium]|nr:trypsin-like peptidase domain-containing protein [Planctomycetota bacterium]